MIASLDTLPTASGAYALIVRLRRRLRAWPDAGPVLGPGLYLYAGSANGPGGIRARVCRHARPKKPRHWHVDRLTENGRVVAVATVPGGNECAIVSALSALPDVTTPAPGFGSSDCATCVSHLVALPQGTGQQNVETALAHALWWRRSRT